MHPIGSTGDVYEITNKRSGSCLDQDFSGGTPHSTVLAWPCNGGANQHWEVTQSLGGFQFLNIGSLSCLDQDYSGGTPHSTILAWPCNNQANQRWFW